MHYLIYVFNSPSSATRGRGVYNSFPLCSPVCSHSQPSCCLFCVLPRRALSSKAVLWCSCFPETCLQGAPWGLSPGHGWNAGRPLSVAVPYKTGLQRDKLYPDRAHVSQGSNRQRCKVRANTYEKVGYHAWFW